MNAQQSLALARVRASYPGRPEVTTVCDAATQWFSLCDRLAERGYVNVTPQIVTSLLPDVTTYAPAQSHGVLRESVSLAEDAPDGEEDA